MPHGAGGFTLLEVLFAVFILALLGALATVAYRPFGRRVDLQTATQQALTTLQRARDRTIASEGSNVYGVHFETGQYVLFTGTTYNSGASTNEVHELPPNVEISDISITGGNAVVFERIEGTTNNPGSITLQVAADADEVSTITILPSGQTSLLGSANPTDSRIVDTRHVHFDLGWSMQNATTLTLTFSDAGGPVVHNVTMADYFNSDKSSFSWEETIDVGGVGQTIRIHTHQLDATGTELSIHRDRRENTKAVDIEIDGQDIVSYAADGTATVGLFGGTMEVQ